MIAVVHYGMGNIGSMLNMLKRVEVRASVEGDPARIAAADKIILPGVGAFDAAMRRIGETPGLREALDEAVLVRRVPVLGVCLGMQLLTRSSEEGRLPGLGWFAGETRRFAKDSGLKVPHMGWNVAVPHGASPLTAGLTQDARYYFVHAYYVQADDDARAIMRTPYGIEFDSAIAHDNIFGVQFHPEKSLRFGMAILRNFGRL